MAARGRKRGPSKSAITAAKVARATLKKILVLRSGELIEELDEVKIDDQTKQRERKVAIVVGKLKNIFEDMLGLEETQYNEYGVDIFSKDTLSAIGIQVDATIEDDDEDEEEEDDD